jgi:IclR family KDG regulon transcriptional repressor
MAETSKTVDQALAVLVELADTGPLTTTEVARRLGLNRTVVYRLLTTLHRRGFVVRKEHGYLLGPMLLSLAEAVQPALRAATRSTMAALRDETGETVVLYIPDGDEHVVIHQAASTTQVLRVEHKIGSRTPLHVGCPAYVILAHSPQSLVDRIARKSDDPGEVYRRVKEAHADGYAITHDEVIEGLHGMAVPVLDQNGRAIAALAMILPSNRASALPGHLGRLTQVARKIAETLRADPAFLAIPATKHKHLPS